MKLNQIQKVHIEQAAIIIDKEGTPKDHVWSQYYVVIAGKEYVFKHLVRTAYAQFSEEKLKFESNESYRNYIKELGYELTYYEGGYNFFTKEELEFYESISEEDYRVKNVHQKYYGVKMYPINRKLKYWLEQIKPEGYKIRYDGKWLGVNSKVSPYLWPRIYSEEDKDIFFNVEVAAYGRFIGFKLDGYYETTKKLPDYKIKILNDFKDKKENNWHWIKIPFDDIHLYNWNSLIEKSKSYIEQQKSNHNYLKKILSKDSKIARIVWNTNSWVRPSGKSGKSTNPSFENENGFGHEEWLFDGDKTIDGYKYGFLEPIHKYRSKYEGKVFDLSLYTKDSESKDSFWVADLKDVEVLNSSDSEKVLDHFKKEGWYDEMKADLYNLNLNADSLDDWIEEGAEQLFNIRFKASQLNNIPSELIPVQDGKKIPSNRYTLMELTDDVQQPSELNDKTGFSFESSGSTKADLDTKGKRKSRKREIELQLMHNILQKKFLNYLQKKYGTNNVKRECTAYGASRIDIVRKSKLGFIFYEIKTYNSLKTSIREGVGQLLEYSLYPNVNEAKNIVLVSHISPTAEIREYLTHIKQFITIPFSFIHFDLDKEEILLEL